MGVEEIECPTCGETVRVGLPRKSEISGLETGARTETAADRKVRPLTCPDGHEFSVAFTVN